jgi:hypothetical protein
LYASAKKFARPTEWTFIKKVFRGMLSVLLAFYIFVVAWNLIILVLSL